MSKNKSASRPVNLARYSLPLGLTLSLPRLLRAEDQVDYRYEYYQEDNNRMTINTHSVYFEQKLVDSIIAKGELVYDGISGATPTGTVYPTGKIALTHLQDNRRSVSLQLDAKLGSNNTLTPGFAYSKESDYQSYGISLNDAIEFNQKNTTLQYGVSQNFDSVRNTDHDTGNFIWSDKYSTEGIVGVSQLLSPKTVFTADFTFGNDSGYLSDPYRLAGYQPTGFPFSIGVPERRPSHRNKEVFYTSLTHYFDKVNGSLEGSYRFYNDSFGVIANTVGLTWREWLGKHLIAEPFFRFYEQSAADFYATTFSGPFTINPNGPPGFHSSDYRLSEFYSTDTGVQLTGVVNDHLRIIVGYHRYEMHGLDGKTSSAMYPQANVVTAGISFLW
jgi:hypothetical protein